MKYVFIQARNIANIDQVNTYINTLIGTDNKYNSNVQKWINSQLKNWLINKAPFVKKVTKVNSKDPEWLKKAIKNKEEVFTIDLLNREFSEKLQHTLDFLNTLNRNINYSVEDAFTATDRWDEQRRRATEKEGIKNIIDKEEDGIEEIHKYNDGFRWVSVFGKESLDREGKLMDHCVGSYYNQVFKGKTKIYSLRDSNNKPHCTIELIYDSIEQIKGYKNGPVSPKYIDYVEDFLVKKYVKISSISNDDLISSGLMQINKKIYNINNLPENITLKELNLRDSKIIKKLPKNLTIKGDLYLTSSSIEELGENLTVTGDLYLSYTKNLKTLPQGISAQIVYLNHSGIERIVHPINAIKLDLEDTHKLEALPDNLIVKKTINLRQSNISRLPKNLTTENLYLGHSNIQELPTDLNIKYIEINNLDKLRTLPNNFTLPGDFDFSETNLIKLPKNLHITGSLFLSESNLKSLPTGLVVDKHLMMNKTKIKILPKDIVVKGNIDLSDSLVQELPENFICYGRLNIKNCDIVELPKGLTVHGTFLCDDLHLTELPPEMTIKLNLDLSQTKIAALGPKLKVGGDLNLTNTRVAVLPRDLRVKGNLRLSRTQIKEIPKGVKIGMSIYASYSDLEVLPKNFTVNKDLILFNTRITELPDNLLVKRDLDLSRTSITKLPENLRVGGDLILYRTNILTLPDSLVVDGLIKVTKKTKSLLNSKFKNRILGENEKPSS